MAFPTLGESIEQAKRMADGQARPVTPIAESFIRPVVALARVETVDGMGKWERAYSGVLEARKAAGEILRWDYEPERFRLSVGAGAGRKDVFYKPDFRVVLANREIEFHEVKGFMRRDALIQVKLASAMHPMYRFVVVTKLKGGKWNYEWFSGGVEA